jgi:hypothetical protein
MHVESSMALQLLCFDEKRISLNKEKLCQRAADFSK